MGIWLSPNYFYHPRKIPHITVPIGRRACLLYKVIVFFSYSAVSSLSGMNHNSTSFVGCDHGKVID